MALLLAEAAKLSLDMLHRGVIETIIEASPVFDYLPFLTVEGNSFKYNQEATLGGASFYPVNGVWVEAAATFTQKTANLAILGGDADVDNFIQRSRSNINDQRGIQVALKAKSVARKFEQTFVTGDSTVDTNSFDGLSVACGGEAATTGQTIRAATNGTALTLVLLDQLLDLVKPARPDILMCTRRTRRKIKALLVASAHYVQSGTNDFGRNVLDYDGIPIFVNDFLTDAKVCGSETAASSVYAVHFGEADGVTGLQNGQIEVVDIGQLETKDASRVRIRWYVGMAVMHDTAVGRLRGINGS